MSGLFAKRAGIKSDQMDLKLRVEAVLRPLGGYYRVTLGFPISQLVSYPREIPDPDDRDHCFTKCVPVVIIALSPRSDGHVSATPVAAVFPRIVEKAYEYHRSREILRRYGSVNVVSLNASSRAKLIRELHDVVPNAVKSPMGTVVRSIGSSRQWRLDRMLHQYFPVHSESLEAVERDEGDAPQVLTEMLCSEIVSRVDNREVEFNLNRHWKNTSFDFVFVEKTAATWVPYMVVEHDGSVHDSPEQKQKDEMKNRICQEANLPLLRVRDPLPNEGDSAAVTMALNSDLPARIALAFAGTTRIRAHEKSLSTRHTSELRRILANNRRLAREERVRLLLSPASSPMSSVELLDTHRELESMRMDEDIEGLLEGLIFQQFLEARYQRVSIREHDDGEVHTFTAECGDDRFSYVFPMKFQHDGTASKTSRNILRSVVRDWARDQVLDELNLADAYIAMMMGSV